jgi:hypothetical protein
MSMREEYSRMDYQIFGHAEFVCIYAEKIMGYRDVNRGLGENRRAIIDLSCRGVP